MGSVVGTDYVSAYTGDQIDAALGKAASYPAASTGTTGQVPTKTANGIEWATPASGGATIYQTITLPAANWTSSEQTVSVPGVSATETDQLIQPVPASASRAEYESCGVRATAQAANSLTFTCTSVPASDLTVYVCMTELEAAT